MIKTLCLILLLTGAAFAQKPLQPVRVSIASDGEVTPTDQQFNDLLREVLGRRATIQFTSARFDVKILTSSTEITESGKLTGYAAATAILTKGAGGSFSMRLHVVAGPTLDRVADDTAAWLDKELKTSRK